jgi:broad specificity phosphatase PhoE
MKTLYFVRHGQTEWNAIRRLQGQWNSDLSELGRAQAHANGRLLAGLGLGAVFASPLDRARQTAEIITGHVGLSVAYDERIKEWDCGEWSGYLQDEVAKRWPEEWAAFHADLFHYRGPGCENFPDMFERARPFVDEVLALEVERVAIVSHGWIGKVMISILLGLWGQETLAIYQPNDVVVRVRTGERPDAHHYRAGEGPFAGLVTHGG